MKLESSTLLSNFMTEAKGMNMIMSPEEALTVIKAEVAGITDFLSQVKNKESATSLLINDLKGNLIIAAIVTYEEAEEEDLPGNWNYSWTFDADDVKDTRKYNITDSGVKGVVSNRGYESFRLAFHSQEFVPQIAVLFFNILIDFLDQNASENEDFTLEFEGFFEASVSVKNGEKVKSFIPDGAMKRLVKDDDAASEKAS